MTISLSTWTTKGHLLNGFEVYSSPAPIGDGLRMVISTCWLVRRKRFRSSYVYGGVSVTTMIWDESRWTFFVSTTHAGTGDDTVQAYYLTGKQGRTRGSGEHGIP